MVSRAARLLLCGLWARAARGVAARAPADDALVLVQGLTALSAEHLRSGREGEASTLADEGGSFTSESLASASASGVGAAATASANASAGANSSAVANASAGLSAEEASLKERAAALVAARLKAAAAEDYDLASQLKREVGVLLAESGVERLRALKRAAAEDEDFDLAKDLKRQIQVLESSSGGEAGNADKVRAYFAAGREPLAFGWRSARDPDSGLEYYWPANDRAAVTWDRPKAPAPGLTPPTAVVRTTTPPPPFEVKSANGGWSRCNVVGSGTKPGTYNITVRGGPSTWIQLANIPGTVIRNATDNATLLTIETFKAALAAARPLLPKVGDRLEVKTRSGKWLPCLVMGLGNETETYNVHVPAAPAGRQDHPNVHVGILRQATDLGARGALAGNSSNGTGAGERAEAAPHSQL